MIRKQSLSKNFIFQLLYQSLIIVIPLILAPYLTRSLQDTSLGIYSYVNTFAYYFVILSNLGISKHGQRVIAQATDNEVKLRKTFWSLFSLHALISMIVMLIYITCIIVFVKQDIAIYYIEIMYVASALFDITWLFYGLENFKSVVIKNGVEKIVECILIFVFVRKPEDLSIYTIITASGILIGQFIMIPQAIRIIKPIRFTKEDLRVHLKPILVFSISAIATTLYTVFDKTLLGLLATKEDVAYYEYSNRIINVPKTVISVIGTVMYPRACRMAVDGDVDGQKKYINYSIFITAFIGLASIWGFFGISDLLSDVYFGESFYKCGSIMKWLSPLVFIIGIGEIIRTQYMLPNGMEKYFNVSVITSAIINIVLSMLAIPFIGIYGAIIGTVSAEIFGLAYQLYICKNYFDIKTIINNTIPFIIIGFIMFFIIKIISKRVAYNMIGLITEVIVGGIVFCVLTILYVVKYRGDIYSIIKKKIRFKNCKEK